MPRRRPDPPPVQQDIFASAAEPAGQRQRVIAVSAAASAGATLSKAQHAFNRLSAQIERLRDDLAMWRDYEGKYHRVVVEKIAPLRREIRAAQIDMLRQADRLLCVPPPPRLPKLHQRKLRALIEMLADSVLGEEPDAEIEALYDRHAGSRWQDQQAAELAEAEALFGAMLGEDAVRGHEAKTFDEFAQHMAGKMADQAQQLHARREQARATAKAGKRAAAAAARKEQAQREASQSVREVFRKLASALHPDREPDAAERERKTRLMQQTNEAYQREDLLALLALQLELDHIDEAHLAGLPEARIALYNQVLREQVRTLEHEIEAATLPLRQALDIPQWGRLKTPALVDLAIQDDLTQMRQVLGGLRCDTQALADPAQRAALMAALPTHYRDDGDDEDEQAEFEALLSDLDKLGSAFAAQPRRRRRH